MQHISLGQLYVIAAASGTGKTSLVSALIETTPDLQVATSYTTRPPREGERNGVNYFFVSSADFLEMKARGEFLESAQVFENHYGTHKEQVNDLRQQGIDVILEIDWQGAQSIRNLYPEAIGIFILPPSLEVLKQRLEARGTDSLEVIRRRLAEAQTEIRHYPEFDYLVINDVFAHALADLTAIIRAQRLRRSHVQVQHETLLNQLSTA